MLRMQLLLPWRSGYNNLMNEAPTQKPINPIAKAQRHATRSTLVSIFSLLIAIAALVLAGFTWQQHMTLSHATEDTHSAIQTSIQQLQTNINTTQQNVTQLMHSVGSDQQQSALSQVAYLINLANLQLNINHNAAPALHLLSIAQSKVEALNDPRLLALNKTLIKDTLALKQAPKLNTTKIISEIDLLNSAIAQSTLIPNKQDLKKAVQTTKTAISKADNQVQHKWYQRLWYHISGVKNLIIVRHYNPKLKPLLDTEQQTLIKSALQAKLLLAEYAVIQHNNTLYHKHINTAKQWVETYYFDSINQQHLLAQFKVLQRIDVSPRVPNIGDTITVLNQTLSAVHTQAGKAM